MKISGLLLCCIVAVATAWPQGSHPTIQASNGAYQGSIIQTEAGQEIFAFYGIPYAQAPTGINQFQASSPVSSHDGVFDASQPGAACALPYKGHQQISKDCLQINIYTKGYPGSESNSRESGKPVIVYFDPVAYNETFGSAAQVGPQYALDQDVVFVTVSYRVGALGFLSTGDSYAPGNAGLKDQVLALKWVQQNIAAFGGNPSSVTLAGQGIGAASVSLHIASPASAGLFHKAIIMSGAVPTYYPLPSEYKSIAKKQAELLGCPSDFSESTYSCLGEKSAQQFADSYEQLSEYYGHPVVFLPVVEQASSSAAGQPFLTAQPADLISQGKGNYVPLIGGVTKDEFGYKAAGPEEQAQNGNSEIYDQFYSNWEELAPKYFGYESGTPKSSQISQALKSYYFNDQPFQAGSYYAFATLYSDALTYYPFYKFEKYFSAYTSSPIYNYVYSYANSHPYKTWSNGTSVGITHYDQFFLLFKVAGYPAHSQKDTQYAQQIWELIANFAEYGNPMPENKIQKYPVQWQPSTASQPQYFEYSGEHAVMVQGYPHQQNMYKWDVIFQSAQSRAL